MKYYIVDAFTSQRFHGNQAGVCLLDAWPDDALLHNIAMENNLAETAFVVPRKDDYHLRWFTPEGEFDLCGHATLATAFVLKTFVDKTAAPLRFHTMSGPLTVVQNGDLYEMDFPSRPPQPVSLLPIMSEAVGVPVLEAHNSRDMVLVVENEAQVRATKPNYDVMRNVPDLFAAIVTAKGDGVDFVSRYFDPNAAIAEDPVTGSAHCTLVPFWAARLGKQTMVARQLSRRGGTLYCQNSGDRVRISGHAVLYLQGELSI